VLLRLAFTVAPIAFGLDKFRNQTMYWPKHLAPWINHRMPGTAQQFMYVGRGRRDRRRRRRPGEAALRRIPRPTPALTVLSRASG
jgi:hypothetical protein